MQLQEGKTYRDTANGFTFEVDTIEDCVVTYTETATQETYQEPLSDLTGFAHEPIVKVDEHWT